MTLQQMPNKSETKPSLEDKMCVRMIVLTLMVDEFDSQ
jgi:hypothetical protein